MEIRLENISFAYGDKVVLDNLSVSFEGGAINCITGPSGCGKSTLLDILAGISKPSCGTLGGLEGRSLAISFQEPRLLPWKSVLDNVAFGLDDALDAQQRRARAGRWLDFVGLSGSDSLMPAQLSGGMAQRVSLARALAPEADILLLDEPFSAVDEALKTTLMSSLAALWAEKGTTVIMVSHNTREINFLQKSLPFKKIVLTLQPLKKG